MNKIFLIISFFAFSLGFSQEDIVGEISLEDLKASDHNIWLERYYNAYQPEEDIIAQLAQALKEKEFQIEVYFGSWCPDSRRELPRLIKLLDEAGWDTNQIQIVGVDQSKKIEGISKEEENRIQLEMIPTFIFSTNEKEVNRFVEFAVETIEKDILLILQNKAYKNPYAN